MIVRLPGVPVTIARLPSFARIVGVMLESMRFAGRGHVRRRANQPVHGREAGTGVEVAHLVVQQEALHPRRRSSSRGLASSVKRHRHGVPALHPRSKGAWFRCFRPAR